MALAGTGLSDWKGMNVIWRAAGLVLRIISLIGFETGLVELGHFVMNGNSWIQSRDRRRRIR